MVDRPRVSSVWVAPAKRCVSLPGTRCLVGSHAIHGMRTSRPPVHPWTSHRVPGSDRRSDHLRSWKTSCNSPSAVWIVLELAWNARW